MDAPDWLAFFSFFSELSVFFVAKGLLVLLVAAALVPGFIGVFVNGVADFFAADTGVRETVGLGGAGLVAGVLDNAPDDDVGLDGVLEPVSVAVFGLGLDDMGVLLVVVVALVVGVFVAEAFCACAFLVALAARSRLVLVGLGLKVLGIGDGRVKGVVLVDIGVLAAGVVFAGGTVEALAGAELGLAVCGLDDNGVLGVVDEVAGLAEAGLVLGAVAEDAVDLEDKFPAGFAVDPGFVLVGVVFAADALGLAGGTDFLEVAG